MRWLAGLVIVVLAVLSDCVYVGLVAGALFAILVDRRPR